MNLSTIQGGVIEFETLKPFLLGYLKHLDFHKYTETEQVQVYDQVVESFTKWGKGLELQFQDIDGEELISLVSNSETKYSESEIKLHLKTLKQIYSKTQQVNWKKKMLETPDRIGLDKQTFIEELTQVFSEIEVKNGNNKFRGKSTTSNILEVPLSDINLEEWYSKKHLKGGFDLIQNIIEQSLKLQIKSNYKYKKINLLFLGNVINRSLSKEQDFQTSLVEYNLIFELSLYLLKVYYLLKQAFPEVQYTFSLDQSNFRDLEMSKDHFNNFNINAERLIPKLLKSHLVHLDLQDSIFDIPEKSFTNAYTYSNNSEYMCMCYGAYKNSNTGVDRSQAKELNLDILEKTLAKTNRIITRSTRIYIGTKELYLTTDRHRDLRYCPSLFHILDTQQLIPVFDITETGIESAKLWFKASTNTSLSLYDIDIKKDIQTYDFIKNTTLTNKADGKPLTILV